jgi:hypothetical protein
MPLPCFGKSARLGSRPAGGGQVLLVELWESWPPVSDGNWPAGSVSRRRPKFFRLLLICLSYQRMAGLTGRAPAYFALTTR